MSSSDNNESMMILIPVDNILLDFILGKYVKQPILSLNTKTDKLACANPSVNYLINSDENNKIKIINVFKKNIENGENVFCIGSSIYVSDAFTMLELCGFEDETDFKGFKWYKKDYIQQHQLLYNNQFYVPFVELEQKESILEFIGELKNNQKEELAKRNKSLKEIKYINYTKLNEIICAESLRQQGLQSPKILLLREDSESLCFILSKVYYQDSIKFEYKPEKESYRCIRSSYGKFLVNLTRIEGFYKKVLELLESCVAYDIDLVEDRGDQLFTSISALRLSQQVVMDIEINRDKFLKLPVSTKLRHYEKKFPFCNVSLLNDKTISLKDLSWLPNAYNLVPQHLRKKIISEVPLKSDNMQSSSSSSSSTSTSSSTKSTKKIKYFAIDEQVYKQNISLLNEIMKRELKDFIKQ
jgi:hypothetical protein